MIICYINCPIHVFTSCAWSHFSLGCALDACFLNIVGTAQHYYLTWFVSLWLSCSHLVDYVGVVHWHKFSCVNKCASDTWLDTLWCNIGLWFLAPLFNVQFSPPLNLQLVYSHSHEHATYGMWCTAQVEHGCILPCIPNVQKTSPKHPWQYEKDCTVSPLEVHLPWQEIVRHFCALSTSIKLAWKHSNTYPRYQACS